MDNRIVYCNGAYLPAQEAQISIFDRSVLFADAIYEVVSVVNGQLLDGDAHLARFVRSAEKMGFATLPDPAQWQDIMVALLSQNQLDEGIIYLHMSRGVDDRNFNFPSADTPPGIFAFTQQKILVDNPMVKTGLRVITRPDKRWHLRDIKTTQLLYASMMKMEAKAAGVDDVWLVDGDEIREGASQNAHIIDKEGVLISHPENQDILHGITRKTLLSVAKNLGYAIEERPFTVAEALSAQEAFVSSASMFVMPVVEIDGAKIGVGHMKGKVGEHALTLREAYIEAVKN